MLLMKKSLPILLISALTFASGFADTDSFWHRLNESSQLAGRYHLTQEHVDNNKDRFPAALNFWKNLPHQIRKHISDIKESDDDKALGEEFHARYGFSLEDLFNQLQGELGGTLTFNLSNAEQSVPSHAILWSTPDNGTEELFKQIRTIWEVDARESESPILLEEVELAGNKALYFLGVTPDEDWVQDEETNDYTKVTKYIPNRRLLVATDKHVAIQFILEADDSALDTADEVAQGYGFTPSAFSFLGEILHGTPQGTFLRQFVQNPAFKGTGSNPVLEVGVNIVPFVKALQELKDSEIKEMQDDPYTSETMLNTLQIDWLEVTGLNNSRTFYGSAFLSPEGMENLFGLEGDFGNHSQNNLLKLMLDKPTSGLKLPTWVPVNASGFAEGSLKLGKIYDLITEQLALHLGTEWTSMINQANTVVKTSTGHELADHFHSIGEHVYAVTGEIIPVTAEQLRQQQVQGDQDADSESYEEKAPLMPTVPQATVFEVANAGALNGLLEQIVMVNTFSGEPLWERVDMQGFKGWQMTRNAIGSNATRWAIVQNNQYLVLSNQDELTNTLLNTIASGSNAQGGFLQIPEVQQLIRSQDVSRLGYISVQDTAIKLNDAREMLLGGSRDNDVSTVGILGQIIDDVEVFDYIKPIFDEVPWDELSKELGYAISTGELDSSNGFLLRSVQTSKLQK